MMNKNQIKPIIIGFILLALMATNPSIEDHRQAVMEEIKKKISGDSKPNDKWEQVGQAIGIAFGQGIIENSVTRDNYIIFSITKINFADKVKNIGFGILGKVYLNDYSSINESFNAQTNANTSESETIPDLASKKYLSNLEIAKSDLPIKMNWYDATNECAKLGLGWRLPTIEELKIICENKYEIGGFDAGNDNSYWSSTSAGQDINGDRFAEIIHIEGCWPNSSAQDGFKKELLNARPVRYKSFIRRP